MKANSIRGCFVCGVFGNVVAGCNCLTVIGSSPEVINNCQFFYNYCSMYSMFLCSILSSSVEQHRHVYQSEHFSVECRCQCSINNCQSLPVLWSRWTILHSTIDIRAAYKRFGWMLLCSSKLSIKLCDPIKQIAYLSALTRVIEQTTYRPLWASLWLNSPYQYPCI